MRFGKVLLASALLLSTSGALGTPANDAYLKAHALNAKSKFEDALPLLDQAIALDPKFTDPYISRSFTYGKLGMVNKALKDVQKALELDPNNEVAYNNRGFLYLRIGQYDKAIADFTRAVTLNPDEEAAWANRAEAEWRASQTADALVDCSKAIGFTSGDADPYITRGDILASQGETLRAIGDYDTAISYHPTRANSFHEPGEVYFKRAEQRKLLANQDTQSAKKDGYPVGLADALQSFKANVIELKTTAAVSDAFQDALKSGQVAACKANDDQTVEITLNSPISAKTFSKILGWNSPYLVSPDVHQNTWEIQIPQNPLGKVEDSRIATKYPQIGSWSVRASVESRPAGDLPEIVAGASPAYSLGNYDSGVTRVRLIKTDL
ncbi:hypothetical protein BH10CYA1_BH10CYA1_20820 [soil metagenome]